MAPLIRLTRREEAKAVRLTADGETDGENSLAEIVKVRTMVMLSAQLDSARHVVVEATMRGVKNALTSND